MYKPVKDYEDYLIFDDGRVFSLKSNRFLKLSPHKSANGTYLSVELFNSNGSKRLLVHRLVAMAFIPNPDNLPQVNHKDENKHNNHVNNLEWCTAKYNMNYGEAAKTRHLNIDYSKSFYKENAIKNGIASRKPVSQFSKDGSFIKNYDSAKQAHLETNVNHSHICECCSGKLKSAGGYVWKYRKEK